MKTDGSTHEKPQLISASNKPVSRAVDEDCLADVNFIYKR